MNGSANRLKKSDRIKICKNDTEICVTQKNVVPLHTF